MLTKERTHRKRLTYEIAELFPAQGNWSEEEYLALETNRLVELSDGEVEILEMPSSFHQLILGRLFLAFSMFLSQRKLGFVRFSPLRVRLWPGKMREPDLVFMSFAHSDRVGEKYWGVPDLVAEILSENEEELDRVIKMSEYAQAGIPEYWIVDPYTRQIEVYVLHGEEYALSNQYRKGDTLTSHQLPGLEIQVHELFVEEKL